MIFSRIYGAGRPLIIIHGLFGMSDNWNTLGKRFAQNFNVHILDLRNHGRSFHSNEFSYNILSQDLKVYIEDNDLENPILLGHSLGGKVAMHFCFNNIISVERLIVVDIAPKRYDMDFHINLLKILQGISLVNFQSRGEIEKELSRNIKDSAIRFFLMKNLYRDKNRYFNWRLNIDGLLNRLHEIQGADFLNNSIDIPTLFIKGDRSEYINNNDEKLIRDHFNNVMFKTINNAGHWLHAEQSDLFYEEALAFIAQ